MEQQCFGNALYKLEVEPSGRRWPQEVTTPLQLVSTGDFGHGATTALENWVSREGRLFRLLAGTSGGRHSEGKLAPNLAEARIASSWQKPGKPRRCGRPRKADWARARFVWLVSNDALNPEAAMK